MGKMKTEVSWEFYIKMNILMLKLMGMWPAGNVCYKSGFYTLYTCMVVSLCVVSYLLFQVINIYFIYDNLEAVAGTIYILLIEFMAAIKVYYLLKNTKILKERIAVIRNDWFQTLNSKQESLIRPSIRFWKSTYNTLFASCVFCNAFWAMYPRLDKSAGERRLPFLSWYPYEYKESPLYEITYVYQVVSCTFLTYIHFNVDTLVSAFNVYTGCKFDLLCDSLRNFATENAYTKLIKCVQDHKEILGFIEDCTNFFNWILFWHLLISGVSIGITMFQLTLVVPFSNEFYSLLSYGSAIVIQIFMYCWFGNEVEVKSNDLPYALFEADWTDLSPEIKQCMLIFTMKLLKPVRISALNIFQMSLDTLMKILKTAWSYFALLYQLSSID